MNNNRKCFGSDVLHHVHVLFFYSSFIRAVTRVVNTYGPQTRGVVQGEAGQQHRAFPATDCGNSAIEERLNNIETHLKLPQGQRRTDGAGGAWTSCCLRSSQILIQRCIDPLIDWTREESGRWSISLTWYRPAMKHLCFPLLEQWHNTAVTHSYSQFVAPWKCPRPASPS